MTTDIRAALERLLNAVDVYEAIGMDEMDDAIAAARAALLPLSYIDPEHQGDDRELLQVFYGACDAEGGTVDEITLRGIRAVLAARPAAPAAPEVGDQPVSQPYKLPENEYWWSPGPRGPWQRIKKLPSLDLSETSLLLINPNFVYPAIPLPQAGEGEA